MKITNLVNKNQKKLYGFDETFKEISSLHIKNKLPKKIILSGQKGIGKATLAYHLINFIFSKNEEYNYNLNEFEINELNRSFNLVKNNCHPNLHVIDLLDKKKMIEIDQIRQMISYSNKSSFNNKERIILIDKVELLNKNALNSLLKIVEEPNSNTYFILILDSNNTILETEKNICLKFNLFLTFKKSLEITNKIIKDDVVKIINSNLLHHYSTPGHYIELIKFSKLNDVDLKKTDLKSFLLYLIENSYYKKDNFINDCIYQYIQFYLLKLINRDNSKNINKIYKKFIEKISNMQKYNLDQESFFIDLKASLFDE